MLPQDETDLHSVTDAAKDAAAAFRNSLVHTSSAEPDDLPTEEVETAEVYSLSGYEGYSFRPMTDSGWSRVVTLQYEMGASRSAAIRKLEEPHFYPGAVSECFYEPDWNPHSPFVPSDHVVFAHEMGYNPLKWLLLGLALGGAGVCFALSLQPDLLGGEIVVASTTVVAVDQVVVKDNTFNPAASSMF